MNNNRGYHCGNCRWWIALRHVRTETFPHQDREAKENSDNGSCRRKSPELVDRSAFSVWPFTEIDEWCGEWAARDVPEPDCHSCVDTGYIGGTTDVTNCKRCNVDKHIVWVWQSFNGGERHFHEHTVNPKPSDPTGTGNGA